MFPHRKRPSRLRSVSDPRGALVIHRINLRRNGPFPSPSGRHTQSVSLLRAVFPCPALEPSALPPVCFHPSACRWSSRALPVQFESALWSWTWENPTLDSAAVEQTEQYSTGSWP